MEHGWRESRLLTPPASRLTFKSSPSLRQSPGRRRRNRGSLRRPRLSTVRELYRPCTPKQLPVETRLPSARRRAGGSPRTNDCSRSARFTYEPSRSAKAAPGKLVRGPVPQRRGEQVLHDQQRHVLEAGRGRFVDPVAFLYPPETHTPPNLAVGRQLPGAGRRTSVILPVKWRDDRLHAAAIGTLLRADGEAAGEPLVFAHRRHRARATSTACGIEPADELGQQIGFFDRQVRREHGRQAAGRGELASKFVERCRSSPARPWPPPSRRRGAGEPLVVVDVMVAVAAVVAHPPLVDCGFSRGLRR